MQSETKSCQNCKKEFVIEPEDFVFYEKIKVPAPEICHECRSQERTAHRNESVLYSRVCDSSGKKIISIYSPDKPVKVYDQNIWWSDSWDASTYGRDYDFSRPFFDQFKELLQDVPRLSIVNKQSTNSDYCNYSNYNKGCYLCFGGHENEECGYCWYNWQDKNCYDCLSVIKSELSYEANFSSGLYKSAYIEYSFDCVECYFSYDLRGCSNCFLSANLRNKQYYFLNEPLTKEEYKIKLDEFWNGSYATLTKILEQFIKIKQGAIRAPVFQRNSVNCAGGDIMYSKNIQFGFDGEYSEDSKYAYPKFSNIYNCMDTNKMGYDRSDYCYMTIGCAGLNNCKFCDTCWTNNDLTYCNHCFSSSNLFGCVGLRQKQYCILNKQYSKEEYQELVPKIIQHMQSTVEWGKFFPPQLSLFAYNETTAQEYTPLSKEEVLALGYSWRDPETKKHVPTILAKDLPDNITEISDAITDEIIACAHAGTCTDQCITAFRITKPELGSYRQLNLPLPRLCHNCRHHARLNARNPLKLWHRNCMKQGCVNEFETSYAPDRPEIVYCESCYQQEVV